jgi:NAD(P)H-dependent flavin oxidoreductase YrpB (nitropropane dioxygenase family)
MNAADDDTMVTNVFTGRPARGIANRLMVARDSAELSARKQRNQTPEREIRSGRRTGFY